MKITDEQVRDLRQWLGQDFVTAQDSYREGKMTWERRNTWLDERIRYALESVFPNPPQGFCTKGTNCRLTDGHEGGCVR